MPSYIGNTFAVGLNDLQILIVYPDAALEIALSFFNGLWSNVEDVSLQLVNLLLSDVHHLIFRQLLGGEREGGAFAQVVHVFFGDVETGLRRKFDVLEAASAVVIDDVGDLAEFSD